MNTVTSPDRPQGLASYAPALGCDLGGTSCKAGLVAPTGEVLAQGRFAVDHRLTVERFWTHLVALAESVTGSHSLAGVGVLVPGYLREERTVLHRAVNLPFLENLPLARRLRDRFQVPVELDLDRNGPALAEHLFHAASRASRLMYVTIGTGVGVGLVINGSVCRVCHDSVGELGHLTFEPDGVRCVCGNIGCIETLISKEGIARLARRLGGCPAAWFGGADGSFPEILCRQAVQGTPAALRVFEAFGRYLGMALVTYANAWSPDLIIVGGGLSEAGEFYLPQAEAYLNAHWFERAQKIIPVRRTAFGLQAGVIGAAALIFSAQRLNEVSG